jgi:hypothetical protein
MSEFKFGQVVSVKWDPYYWVRGVVISEVKNGKVGVDVGFGDEYRVPVKNVKVFNRKENNND